MTGTGWIVLIGASVAGIALYLYDTKNQSTGNATRANALKTVVTAQGSCAANADGTYSCMTDPDADPQGGNQVTPPVQTEAAYNADTTNGDGTDITIGGNAQQTDYSTYDDPSELD